MIVNADRWAHEFRTEAQFAIDNKDIYITIENQSGVRWYHVAIIHRREGNANFQTYLGNGQSLKHRTTEVPIGRGPFSSFVAGALDALKVDGLSDIIDWRLEKILYFCEVFNGGGYSRLGLPSPYLWGGTNIQERGKFTSDHHLDRTVWDTQPGCAPLLMAIAALDTTIRFERET